MNFNYSIEQCKGTIFAAIEQSGLPIGVIHYLFKDICNEVERVYNNVLQQESTQANAMINPPVEEEEDEPVFEEEAN